MDSSVVLVVVVIGLAAVVAGLAVLLRRRLPAEVLAEVEAVAMSIRQALGDLATEERVRWMAGYVYDVAVSEADQSRVSREEFATLVWQAVERWVAVDAATQLAGVAMSTAGLNGR